MCDIAFKLNLLMQRLYTYNYVQCMCYVEYTHSYLPLNVAMTGIPCCDHGHMSSPQAHL